MSLSTALCRPTSSRTVATEPSGATTPAACTAPVASNSSCPGRSSSGAAASASHGRGSPVTGASLVTSSSISLVPQKPHDEVVVVSRGRGGGALPPVDTDTTLKSVAAAEPLAQYLTWVTP